MVVDKTEKQFLSLGAIAKSRTAANSELLKRPEYGLSMMCSSIEGASTDLAKYGGDWMAKSGPEEMKALFAEDSGKSFLKAAEFLNMDNKDLKRDADGVVEHTKHMVDWMQTDAAAKAKIMRKVARAQRASTWAAWLCWRAWRWQTTKPIGQRTFPRLARRLK